MVHFIFQMNLQLILWIGLISSVCYVFGQAGKKSFIVVFSLQYLMSLFDHFRFLEKPTSRRLAPSEKPCRGLTCLRVEGGALPVPARPFLRLSPSHPE